MKDKLIGRPEPKSVFECLLLIVLVAGATFAQDNSSAVFSSQTFSPPYSPSTHSNHAILRGIVTKDSDSVPLKKALIELIADSQNDGRNYTALSGADGSFRIEDVVPGRYRLFAERSGYQEIDKHRVRSEGARIEEGARNTWMSVGIAYQIRARAVEANRSSAIGIRDGNNIRRGVVIASSGGEYASHLPVSDDLVQDAGGILAERFAATERQIILIAEDEAMTNVEIRIAVVLLGKALVLEIPVVYRA